MYIFLEIFLAILLTTSSSFIIQNYNDYYIDLLNYPIISYLILISDLYQLN